jgi:hypothetical protein
LSELGFHLSRAIGLPLMSIPAHFGASHYHTFLNQTITLWYITPSHFGSSHHHTLMHHTITLWCITPSHFGVSHHHTLVYHTITLWCLSVDHCTLVSHTIGVSCDYHTLESYKNKIILPSLCFFVFVPSILQHKCTSKND